MRRKISTLALAACLILASTAFSANLEFPNKRGGAVDLRVTGPGGFELSQSFKAGEMVSISLFDKAGYPLADGSYNWEMTFKGEATGDRDGFHAKAENPSGAFSIKDGAVVNKDAIELGSTKDQVFLDDLIVDGSACIGMDCVNGESFGFDTIRMKENNLRLRAVDTSSTSSFPTRDWQITFNDSSNGGANKFSIDDIDGGRTPFTIEAGAPSHSLYVDDGGRIGLGTSTPVADIHVKSGNTPTLRLEQDGSSGFTAQTWDVASNEANFFVRDATNGSTLPLRIFPGAPSNALNIEASTGDIGLGTTSPDEELHILNDAGNAAIRLESSGDYATLQVQGSGQIQLRTSANDIPVRIGQTAGDNLLNIGVSADGTADAAGEVNIAGNLIISGDCSEQNGACADYVFEPGYEYRPLEELAQFIAENKHLPNVPSADEMKRNGVNMTFLSGRLLEKIEELVLYTLEQQGTIEGLEARLESLEGND